MIKFTLNGKDFVRHDIRYKENNCGLIVLFWYTIIITDIIRKIPTFSNYSGIVRDLLYGLVIVGVLIAAILRHQLKYIVIPAIMVTSLVLISVLLYPQLISLRTDFLLFYGRCLCGFYLAATVTNWEIVFKTLASFHWISLFYALKILVSGSDVYTNYMSLAYGLLVPALITAFYGKNTGKKSFLISATIIILAIFTYGARGPCFCIAIAILFYFFMGTGDKITIKKIALFVSVIVIIVFAINNYNSIINVLHSKWGDSRTISFLYKGRLFDGSGRDLIMTSVLNELIRYPFHPRGILADRIFLSEITGSLVQSGPYPHNFILEIWYQFGIIGLAAIFVLLWILILLYFRTKCEKNFYNNISFIVFVIVAMIKLMFTGTYFSDMQSWFCFGTIVNFYNRLIANSNNSLSLEKC